ncbi:MAG: hypothetical protein GX446_12275 [Chthonomonadales bacterium]|nr:hypothetical protein [Chthonomonadales bacterium]
MEPKLRYLGWSRPPVETVAEYLCSRAPTPTSDASPGVLDLSHIVVAVTTSRFGRRTLELLAERADRTQALIPPTIVPIGALHQHLWQPPLRRATPTEEMLAWLAAMQAVGDETCAAVTRASVSSEMLARSSVAMQLSATHRALRAAGLDARTALSVIGSRAPEISRRRWQALAAIEQAFIEQLDAAGLSDPAFIGLVGPSLARNAGDRVTTASPTVVLADVPELPSALSQALCESGSEVEALVCAPETEAAGFSSMGGLVVDAWHDRAIDLSSAAVLTAQSVPDQAAAALAFLKPIADGYGQDDVSVALPDPSIEDVIREVFSAGGVRTHSAFPRPLSASRPASLLAALCAYMNGYRADALAQLARHPDFDLASADAARSSPARALAELDRFRAQHLPKTIARITGGTGSADVELRHVAAVAQQAVRALGGPRRPLPEWAEPIAQILMTFYGPALAYEPRGSTALVSALETFGDLLREVSSVSPRLAHGWTMSGADAARLVLHRATLLSESDPVREPAAELLNWFELAHDDAPIKAVIGMNDGRIPETAPDDAFLPDTVRQDLGLPCSRSRQARDVLYLTRLAASTPHLALVVGTQSLTGDILRPSRLLFACDVALLPQRAQSLFGRDGTGRGITVPFVFGDRSRFGIPRPRPVAEPITRLSVTAFGDYLRCPYRFYLRHVLGLRSDEDELHEMDALLFGSLIHAALATFGAGPAASETSEDAVAQALAESLDMAASRLLGPDPSAAVQLQLQQAGARLRSFASWQARRAAAGWMIVPDGVEVDAEGLITVDDVPLAVHGRIDRIERHRDTGAFAIFDYKTGDASRPPNVVHRSAASDEYGWSDLQLPLYRRIAPIPPDAPTTLGYLWLGPKLDSDPLQEAKWSESDLESAATCIDKVVRDIRAGRFWPPSVGVPPTGDGIGAICMESCAERIALIANPEPEWDDA